MILKTDNMKFEKTLFIFRRDLRLEDNTGLIFALKNSKSVIPAFIFTPEQIEHNPYRSDHCLQFMLESLQDLDNELKRKGSSLFLFFGKPFEVVEKIIAKEKVDAVIVNCDYTPYSIQRDQKIAAVCKTKDVSFHSFEDALLHAPETILKEDQSPYKVFTPYYKKALQFEVPPALKNSSHNYFKGKISFSDEKLLQNLLGEKKELQKGGRKEGLKLLKAADNSPTHLSPHLKFTTLSVREIYAQAPKLARSLIWRDFFTMIAYHFPHVFAGPFYKKFEKIKWNTDKKAFKRWCEGQTGFPIVDAAMRQLNATGFIENRFRMIVGSFLVKDLHINWQWGEKYFAQKLIDYDPAVNNGNWQWVASTGCDHVPYFRIFNPWTQQKKFDPNCDYIKTWIEELQDLEPKQIHRLNLEFPQEISYPKPMVDHNQQSKITFSLYNLP